MYGRRCARALTKVYQSVFSVTISPRKKRRITSSASAIRSRWVFGSIPNISASVPQLKGAIKELRDHGEDAKLLAGGHSLIPLMKLRLATPSLLVDLRKVPGLHGVEQQDGHWRIGALTPHAVV